MDFSKIKPLEILERIIKANTNEGDIVLDLFSGSGSTALACDNTGREFIGSELSSVYYEKSLERRIEWAKNNNIDLAPKSSLITY